MKTYSYYIINTCYLKILQRDHKSKIPQLDYRKTCQSWNFQYLIAKLTIDIFHIIIYTQTCISQKLILSL